MLYMHDMHVSSSSYDRQVTEAPFHIIAGSGEKTLSEHTCPNSGLGGTGDHHADLRSAAIYLANLHRAAYDTNVGVWAGMSILIGLFCSLIGLFCKTHHREFVRLTASMSALRNSRALLLFNRSLL